MMRLTMMLALLIASSIPAPAFAAPAPQGPPELVQFCKGDVAIDTRFTLGDCVGFLNTAISVAPGFIPQLCDYIRVLDPDTLYAAYDSYSECVRDGASELAL